MVRIVPREYRDSVSLMQLSAMLGKLPGVEQASAVMATENNLALLAEAGMRVDVRGASASDLLIVVQGEKSALPAAIEEAVKSLTRQTEDNGAEARAALRPRSIQMALKTTPEANMALISTPGDYAAAEAMKALRLGLNVMLFSNNVSEEEELVLKRFARDADLIVMGPDCGTAIINGTPLAFANVVKRGPVGVVGASGTGLQQVTVLVDRLGSGISQAIGTGGRDLHRDIGGDLDAQGSEGPRRRSRHPGHRADFQTACSRGGRARAGRGREGGQAGGGELPRHRSESRSRARACTQ